MTSTYGASSGRSASTAGCDASRASGTPAGASARSSVRDSFSRYNRLSGTADVPNGSIRMAALPPRRWISASAPVESGSAVTLGVRTRIVRPPRSSGRRSVWPGWIVMATQDAQGAPPAGGCAKATYGTKYGKKQTPSRAATSWAYNVRLVMTTGPVVGLSHTRIV